MTDAYPHDRRDAALVAVVSVVLAVAAWPVADMPFNDDPSYTLTAANLARTGHLAYNGWATAAGVSHAAWGAAWVRLFGFSFTTLRLSTLPLAAGSVALTHALARRAGLRPQFAAFAALLLGTSPLFLPLADSYMTDVPGLCFALTSLYGLTRAADNASVGWLALGVLAGCVGGTGRQVVWVAPLAVLAVVAWVRRADRAVLIAAAVGWVATVATAAVTVRWFARQPFALPEPPLWSALAEANHHRAAFAGQLLAIVPTAAALTLPAAVGLLGGPWRRRSIVTAAVVLAAGLVLIRLRPSVAVGPWMGNTLTTHGVLGFATIAGPRPATLSPRACQALSIATLAVLAAVVGQVVQWVTSPRRPHATGLHARAVLLAFAAGYVVLLLPRCARREAYDRYVLDLIPVVTIGLLLTVQSRRPWPSAVAWGLLAIWAAYALGTTQEVWAMNRARVAAADALGVPRTQVAGGLEFDWWTELSAAGHLNSTRLPAGVYRPGLGLTPSIHPRYRLEVGPATRPTPGAVVFHTLLPPFRRQVVAVPVR